MPPALHLPEVTLHDGARLFVAAYDLRAPPVPGALRYSFYALAWLSGGGATVICDSERFEALPGSLVCTAPGQVTWWSDPAPGAHLTLLGFIPEIFTGGALDVHLITDLPLFKPDAATVIAVPEPTAQALATLFAQVWSRYTQSASPGPEGTWRILPRRREGLMLGYLHAILAEAATLDSGPATALSPTQSADHRLARLFRIHVVGSALQRRPVAHYAALLHVTPDHLTRVVGRVTGKSPSAWLQDRVLVEAVRLLTFTERPIERVAEDLHFPAASQFSQWFRARTGQTPSRFRQGAGGTSDIRQNAQGSELA